MVGDDARAGLGGRVEYAEVWVEEEKVDYDGEKDEDGEAAEWELRWREHVYFCSISLFDMIKMK